MTIGGFLRRMLGWLKPYPGPAALIFLGLLTDMAWNSIVPKSFEHMIDQAIVPHRYGVRVNVLIFLGVGALVVSAVGLLRDYLYAKLSNRVTRDIRLRLFEHLQRLSLSYHAKRSTGDIAARFSGDLNSVKQALDSFIAWGALPALDVILMNFLLFTIDWRLALISQLIWPLALLGPRLIAPRATASAFRYRQEEGEVLACVQECVNGRPVIRAFGLEPSMERGFLGRIATLARTGIHTSFLTALLERSSGIGIMVLQVVVLGVGGTLVFRGSLTLGALVAFQSLFVAMSYALFYLAQYLPTLSQSAAGLQRLDEIFKEVPQVTAIPNPRPLPPLTGNIEVERVVFAHEADRRILDGISLTIRHGESVALIGPSGSGKSTLLGLLLRFHDPQEGCISNDGVLLREASRADFTGQIGVVFQESFLFNLSIRDNIRLGRGDATDAGVEAAARAAEIHDYIRTLPQGYDTAVGDRGGLLSGGQRQRIAIARALIRNPRVLFLDEATSALDPGTEAAINEIINRVGRGRTVISVTHRLSSVVNYDRIFVLSGGRLAESGRHAELLANGGLYASLWKKQDGLQVSGDGTEAGVAAERLRAIPLLANVDEAVLEKLASERLVSESVPAGRAIVVEGEPGDKFFLVVRGAVAVSQKLPKGERRLAVLQDGDHFGEIALLENTPRTASVTALVPTTLLSLSRGHFISLLDQVPGLREKIKAEHAVRLEKMEAGVR